ncbi:MAG: hypothetical protein E7554_03170 [Ruminococcaceae bacterium]|nr:hypothetical protein [Oscillospiraceae bacterium]
MKRVIFGIALCFATLALVGCGHEHTIAERWSLDPEQHWHECGECGEKIDPVSHTYNGEYNDGLGICSVCNSGTFYGDNGGYETYSFDESDNLIFIGYYDADGNEIFYSRTEYDYYPDGSAKYAGEYVCDKVKGTGEERLIAEYEYLPCENGENEFGEKVYCSKETSFCDDGTYWVIKYDERFGAIEDIQYDKDGSIISTTTYEYETDENGEVVSQTMYMDGVINAQSIYDYDEDGVQYEAVWRIYDENGELTEEIHYDSDGNEIE